MYFSSIFMRRSQVEKNTLISRAHTSNKEIETRQRPTVIAISSSEAKMLTNFSLKDLLSQRCFGDGGKPQLSLLMVHGLRA